mgnify:CR=1 FL=1
MTLDTKNRESYACDNGNNDITENVIWKQKDSWTDFHFWDWSSPTILWLHGQVKTKLWAMIYICHIETISGHHTIFKSRPIFNVRVFAAISVLWRSCSLGHGWLDVGLGNWTTNGKFSCNCVNIASLTGRWVIILFVWLSSLYAKL